MKLHLKAENDEATYPEVIFL